jgi:Methyltransferase domain
MGVNVAENNTVWRQRLRRLARPAWLGTLRRLSPLSDSWGFDRGTPVDRYYIERFLEQHRQDIRGRVLEIRDSTYTNRFGTEVVQSDVLDLNPSNAHATIIADLTAAEAVPANLFDCFILTQTLQFIYDTPSAIAHAFRMLRPGGVLLATVPSVSRLAPRYGPATEYWRFTPASCKALFGEVFGADQIVIQAHGNVLSAMAFLIGMAQEELSPTELETNDPYFPLVIAIRAVKPSEPEDVRVAGRGGELPHER